MTRGEPRPVHITLIATCRVYNSVVVIRGITPGLSPGYETRQTVESTFFSVSRDLPVGGGCRAPQPAQKHNWQGLLLGFYALGPLSGLL